MNIRLENLKENTWSVRSAFNEKLFQGSLEGCQSYIVRKEMADLATRREENIRKDDFNKQKPFTTSPIGGHLKQ